eukprot:GHVN01043050.1.p2 GENE.GHVN01043050.1~~GHVN01043050.1.p2  ORF type:complete len:102 (-),score=5.72 GHVN01043050.1:927-1232(-)
MGYNWRSGRTIQLSLCLPKLLTFVQMVRGKFDTQIQSLLKSVPMTGVGTLADYVDTIAGLLFPGFVGVRVAESRIFKRERATKTLDAYRELHERQAMGGRE